MPTVSISDASGSGQVGLEQPNVATGLRPHSFWQRFPAAARTIKRWAGGVDSVGSTTLANLLSMTKYGGAIAACGLAAGMDLPSSVAPFILRGVCLLGIDSVMCPLPQRQVAWARLAKDLDHSKLAEITHEIGLADVIGQGAKILAGQVRGRIVVKIL